MIELKSPQLHMVKFLPMLLIFIIINETYFAQTDSSSISTEEIINNLLQEPAEENENEDIYQIIEDIVDNPIDLNTARLTDLQRVPGMSAYNAALILNHRKKYGAFFSTDELDLVEDLTSDFTEKVKPFLIVNPKIFESALESGEQGLSIWDGLTNNLKLNIRSRFINDLQEKRGFSENKYEGTNPKIYTRFTLKYAGLIDAGLTTEKDAGERSLNEFTSLHFTLKDYGIIKNLTLGDYTLEFGQGLALWSPYALSKGTDAVFPSNRKAKIINPYKSTNENNFFRGAAVTIAIDNFLVSSFYSKNYFDANIDSISQAILSTPIDGYHRTENEIAKRKAAEETVYGGRIDFIDPKDIFTAGLLIYNSQFSNSFVPSNIFDIDGDRFQFYSLYYNFNAGRVNIFGESAFDSRSIASLLGTTISLADNFSFVTLVRNYPRNYRNLHSFGFGENSGTTKNEFGIYTGIQWMTSIGEINFYYDQFKFPYATYENPLPSAGDEFLFDIRSKPIQRIETNFRIKYENKEITEKIENLESLTNRLKYSIRGEVVYTVSDKLRLKTRVEINQIDIAGIKLSERGMMIFQDVRISPFQNLTLDGRFFFYQTDSFNSAIYSYENDLRGILSSTALYGKGVKWYLLIKFKPMQFISLSAKYSETFKPLEKTLGSGFSEINNNVDNRISFQAEMNF